MVITTLRLTKMIGLKTDMAARTPSFVDRIKGITLIELMVALGIAAAMMMFAVPAFNDFTSQRRLASNVNAFVTAVNYARNEAGRRLTNVTVQAVDAADNNNEWGPGFCVVEGNPGNCNNPITVFQTEAGNTLDGVGNFEGRDRLTFNARGMSVLLLDGQIEVCGADADDDPGRIVRMSAIGRASTDQFVCFP